MANRSISWLGILVGAPFYLLFVAVPSAVPLIAAPYGWTRRVVLVVMTAVAGWAGVQIVVSDDAQAGFAVFWVPYVAFPLAVVLCVGRSIRYTIDRRW